MMPGLGPDPEKGAADSPSLRQPLRTPRLVLDRQTQSRGSATMKGPEGCAIPGHPGLADQATWAL